MDSQHTEQTRRLEDDLRNLGHRLDRHLEVYAANGKELAAVKEHMSSMDRTVQDFYDFFKRHDEREQMLHDKFVTDDEFHTVRNIVYGAAALILTSVLVAIIGLVVFET